MRKCKQGGERKIVGDCIPALARAGQGLVSPEYTTFQPLTCLRTSP